MGGGLFGAGQPEKRRPRVLAISVGADSISARFAAPQTPAGGIHPSPTANGGSAANRENSGPRVITNLCRGRFYIGPVCGGANARGRDKSRPYDRRRACSRPENSGPRVITNLCRGRCLHRPGGPRRAANARGRDKSRPYGRRRACSQPGKPWPRVITNLCRGRCSHRPGDPAAPQTPAGGINSSPTNHGKRPAKRDSHTPPGGRRAGCPHPAGPRRAANTCGRIWNPPLQWVPRIGNMRCSRLARNTQNDCRAGCPHPAGPAARRPENRPPRCALPVSPSQFPPPLAIFPGARYNKTM